MKMVAVAGKRVACRPDASHSEAKQSARSNGGEEPEITGIYLVDDTGQPWRLGFALGNEFSDHVVERQNYRNLPPGPALQAGGGVWRTS